MNATAVDPKATRSKAIERFLKRNYCLTKFLEHRKHQVESREALRAHLRGGGGFGHGRGGGLLSPRAVPSAIVTVRAYGRALKLCKLGRVADAVAARTPAERAPRTRLPSKLSRFLPRGRSDARRAPPSLAPQGSRRRGRFLPRHADDSGREARARLRTFRGPSRAHPSSAGQRNGGGDCPHENNRSRDTPVNSRSILEIAGGRLTALAARQPRRRPHCGTSRKLALSTIARQVSVSLPRHFTSS